jgi:hypothetical protein
MLYNVIHTSHLFGSRMDLSNRQLGTDLLDVIDQPGQWGAKDRTPMNDLFRNLYYYYGT